MFVILNDIFCKSSVKCLNKNHLRRGMRFQDGGGWVVDWETVVKAPTK
jgi:hypothetical protein